MTTGNAEEVVQGMFDRLEVRLEDINQAEMLGHLEQTEPMRAHAAEFAAKEAREAAEAAAQVAKLPQCEETWLVSYGTDIVEEVATEVVSVSVFGSRNVLGWRESKQAPSKRMALETIQCAMAFPRPLQGDPRRPKRLFLSRSLEQYHMTLGKYLDSIGVTHDIDDSKGAPDARAMERAEERALALKKDGNEALARGDHAEAARLYTDALAALDLVPDRSVARATLLSNRAAAYLALTRAEDALADAEQCVQLRPDWPKGYFRQARALRAMDADHLALSACSLGMQRAPTDREFLEMLIDIIKFPEEVDHMLRILDDPRFTLLDAFRVRAAEHLSGVIQRGRQDPTVFEQYSERWSAVGGPRIAQLLTVHRNPRLQQLGEEFVRAFETEPSTGSSPGR